MARTKKTPKRTPTPRKTWTDQADKLAKAHARFVECDENLTLATAQQNALHSVATYYQNNPKINMNCGGGGGVTYVPDDVKARREYEPTLRPQVQREMMERHAAKRATFAAAVEKAQADWDAAKKAQEEIAREWALMPAPN
tara:strand:- start:114 stop:536 length:423 start_codon:yes stop_codon:yes gene_type:complete